MALLLALALPVAAAGDDEDFYRGKTISLIIPIGPGGAYDTYSRLVARYLGKYLPGNPTIVPRNMPGAGGTIASNHAYNLAPQDGTTLLMITSSFAMEQLFENPQIKYDARKFLAIGRLLDTTSVIFFWHTSPIKTVDDLRKRPSTVGISGVYEIPAARMRAMNRFLGMQMKLIPGYPSARDYVLAVEREETDGGTSTYIGLSQLYAAYLREKKLNIVVQFALTRDADMPDVPTVMELTNDPEVRQIFSYLVSNDDNRPLALHHPERAAGAARLAAGCVPENARRSGIPGRGRAAQSAALPQDRRGDAEGGGRQLRRLAGDARQDQGSDEAVSARHRG